MKVLGISEGFHDAAICILNDTKIHYASSSERYMKNNGPNKNLILSLTMKNLFVKI